MEGTMPQPQIIFRVSPEEKNDFSHNLIDEKLDKTKLLKYIIHKYNINKTFRSSISKETREFIKGEK